MTKATPTEQRRARAADGTAPAILTPEQARALFDEHAQRDLQISGQAFIEAWNRGEYNFDPDFSPEVGHLWMLMPFGLAR